MTELLARIESTVIIAMCIAFLGISVAHAGWVPSDSSQPVPAGAVLAGTEQNNSNAGSKLYVCRAAFEGGLHPGKLVESWRWCHFGWGGEEWAVETYDVLIENGTWKTGTIDAALIGGYEADGTPLYICRRTVRIDGVDHGTASGKVVGNTCHIGYGGYEWENSSYLLFYQGSTPPSPLYGSVSPAITTDVYNSYGNCNIGRFRLESGQYQEVGGQYTAGSYPGYGTCSYRALFTNVSPGPNTVCFDGYNACGSINITAGQVTNKMLYPNRRN